MRITRELNWDDLPHHAQVGYGREGLVLRLSDTKCVKVYSPLHQANAEIEHYNLGLMLECNLKVPRPQEVVRVLNPSGRKMMLPGANYRMIELYPWENREVLGLVREFIPGIVIGSRTPSITQLVQLRAYLDRAENEGLALGNPIPANFVDNKGEIYFVDTSGLKKAAEFYDLNNFQDQVEYHQKRLLSPETWNESVQKDDFLATLEMVRRIL